MKNFNIIMLVFLCAVAFFMAHGVCVISMFHSFPGEARMAFYRGIMEWFFVTRFLFMIEEVIMAILHRFKPTSCWLYIALEILCGAGVCAGILVFPVLTGLCMVLVPILIAIIK